MVLLAEPNLTHGAALYDTCAACHGPTGAGARDGSVPAIGGQHFKVVARQLTDFRSGNRPDERMQHFTNLHHLKDAQEVADVAAYVNALTPAKDPGLGEGKASPEGAQVYARACATCHGRNAQGSSTLAIPRLAGQQYVYLLQQMQDIVDGRRPDYSPQHSVLFNRLHRAQFVSVSEYLAHVDAAPP
jgi:cytochrome c553